MKSSTIVTEYVWRDEKSDREVYDLKGILAVRMANFQSGGKKGNLGNKNILKVMNIWAIRGTLLKWLDVS